MRRVLRAIALGGAASLVLASTVMASHCVNASKAPAAGAQVVLNIATNEIVWTTQGLTTRFAQGLVDPVTGEGFHGLLGLDFDGDGVADLTVWYGVGPGGLQVPPQAQLNGPACQGVTNIETFLAECLGG
jgi:hypothetical protein